MTAPTRTLTLAAARDILRTFIIDAANCELTTGQDGEALEALEVLYNERTRRLPLMASAYSEVER